MFQQSIPPGPELLVKEGDTVKADQALTNNPNVGGFGQAETEVVLQKPCTYSRFISFLCNYFISTSIPCY